MELRAVSGASPGHVTLSQCLEKKGRFWLLGWALEAHESGCLSAAGNEVPVILNMSGHPLWGLGLLTCRMGIRVDEMVCQSFRDGTFQV